MQLFAKKNKKENLFTCICRIWAQVWGWLVDEWPRPKRVPPFNGTPYSPRWWVSSCHVHTATGGAKAELWTCATEPAPTQTHKHYVILTRVSLFSVYPIFALGHTQTGHCVFVCIPALLLWGAVWCVGWSGLGWRALPLFSGLHALNLQFLNSNDKTNNLMLRPYMGSSVSQICTLCIILCYLICIWNNIRSAVY